MQKAFGGNRWRENHICCTLRVGVKLDYFCAIQLKPTQWHFRKVVCKGPPSLPLPFLLFSFSCSLSLLLSSSSSSFSAQAGGGDGVQWKVPPHAASASGKQQNPPATRNAGVLLGMVVQDSSFSHCGHRALCKPRNNSPLNFNVETANLWWNNSQIICLSGR